MSIATDIHSGAPEAPEFVEGDGWGASLCFAWAQIVEGSTECEACGEPARAVIATGADPEFAAVCWKHCAAMLFASGDMGAQIFGEAE